MHPIINPLRPAAGRQARVHVMLPQLPQPRLRLSPTVSPALLQRLVHGAICSPVLSSADRPVCSMPNRRYEDGDQDRDADMQPGRVHHGHRDRQGDIYSHLYYHRLPEPKVHGDGDREQLLHVYGNGQVHVYHHRHLIGVLLHQALMPDHHIHSHLLQVLSGP